MRDYRCASVTVVAAISMMLVAGLLFSLLEVGRYREISKTSKVDTEAALESLFANYNRALWDEYHFLAVEAGDSNVYSKESREGYLKDLIDSEIGAKTKGNLVSAGVSNVKLKDYKYVTDDEGAAFEASVTSYMQNNLVYEAYSGLKTLSDSIASLDDVGLDEKMDNARKLIDESIDEANSIAHPIPKDIATEKFQILDLRTMKREMLRCYAVQNMNVRVNLRKTLSGDEDALAAAGQIQASGVSTMVLPAGTKVSGKSIDLSSVCSKRERKAGTADQISSNFYQTMMTELYLGHYYSSYVNPKDGRGLTYELEYVLSGAKSDAENLNQAIIKLFAVRELANFSYLLTDQKRMEQAEIMAGVAAAVLLSPEAMEGIKYGLLASWATAESILDIRALLKGKKIALIKNSAQWSSNLWNLFEVFNSDRCSEECENGIDYQMYLLALLLLKSCENRSLRALDVMEATVREKEHRKEFCINDCMIDCSVNVTYRYKSVFCGMDVLTAKKNGRFYLEQKAHYSYRKAGA